MTDNPDERSDGQVPAGDVDFGQELGKLPEWDIDDTISETGKSTCSSNYPFGSPNPSDLDEHGNILESADRRRRRKQGEGSAQRPAFPMSERQQMMALLKQITKPEQGLESPKSPSQTPGSSRSRGRVARIHRRNDRGETPLHTAARKGDHRQCRKLLQEGAEVNSVDYAGWTSLHEACNHGWYKVARVLIAYGADVNASGLDDDTPLHDAVSSGNKKLMALLLRHNADVNKVNKAGHRPADTAEDEEVKKLLLSSDHSPHVSSGTASDLDSEHELTALSPGKFHLTPLTEKPSEASAMKDETDFEDESAPLQLDDGATTEEAEEKEEGEITDDTDGKEEEDEEGETRSPVSTNETPETPVPEEKVAEGVAELKIEEDLEPTEITDGTGGDKETQEEVIMDTVSDEKMTVNESAARACEEREAAEQKKPVRTPLTKRASGIRSPRLGASPAHSATAAAVKSLRKRDMIFRKRHQLQQQQQESARKKRRAEMRGRKRKLIESSGQDIYDFHSSESEQEEEPGEPRRLFHSKTPTKLTEDDEPERKISDTASLDQQLPTEDTVCVPSKRTGMTRKERILREVSAEEGDNEKPNGDSAAGEEPLKVPPLRIILHSTSRSASDDEAGTDAAAASFRAGNQPYVLQQEGDEVASEPGGASKVRGKDVSGGGNGGSGNSSQEGGEKSQRLTRSQLRAGRGQLEAPTPPAAKQEDTSSGVGGFSILQAGTVRGPRKPWGGNRQSKPIEPTSVATGSKSHWNTSDVSQTTAILKKNSYEGYRDLREIVESRWAVDKGGNVKEYVPPKNYQNFLMNKKTYLLQKSMADAPQELSPPQTLTEPMLSLFKKQESTRCALRCQHKVERERLILCCEKEVMRSHARDTKASFLSAVRVMRDAEVYNPLELEKQNVDKSTQSSNCDLQEVLETVRLRFKKKKMELINRQRMEAHSLQASQLMTWEAQLKKSGLVEPSQWHKLEKSRKKTAMSVPSVQILEDFDLLPPGSGV